MGWFIKKITKTYDKKVSSLGMSIFRISIGLVLLFEVIELYKYKQLLFDKVPFVEPYELDFSYALVLWMLICVFIILGFYTRISTVINYIFLLVFIGTIKTYEYHMFYAYMGIGFVMMFLPLNKSLSIDRIILRVKNTNSKTTYNPDTKISVIYYFIPVYVVIGLVYFDSVFFKFTSHNWMTGLGMWEPAILPQFNHYGDSFALNNEFFSKSLGYTTLIFETVFIFLFWYKPFRIPFLIIGFGLHIGILLFFPIPLFALGVSAVYLLMVPLKFWENLATLFKSKRSSLVFIYDADCPLCNRTKVVISSFDIFNRISFITAQCIKQHEQYATYVDKINDSDLLYDIHSIDRKGKVRKGVDTYIAVLFNMLYTFPIAILILIPGIYHIGKIIYRKIAENRERNPCTDENCSIQIPHLPQNSDDTKIFTNVRIKDVRVRLIGLFFIGITLLQAMVSYESTLTKNIRKSLGLYDTGIDQFLTQQSHLAQHFGKKFFGITNHPVFMDGHMNGYNHIIALTYIQNGKEIWLPIIDKNGMPDDYIYGPRWVKWTFRVNAPSINDANLNKGLMDFTAFWLGKQGLPHHNQSFIIKVKKIKIPRIFEGNLFQKQINNRWMNAGTLIWKNKKCSISIPKSIEAL